MVGGEGASCAFLNGANGEYTGTDGVRNRNRPAAQARRALQATRRVAGRLANRYIARATGINVSRAARQPTVRAPMVSAQKQVTQTANIVRTGDSIRVRHREFVGNINGSVDYTVVGDYDMNPGNSRLLPWLSTQAVSWEKYVFHSVTFEYITRCSTTTAGSVLMLPVYDSKEKTPTDEAAATTFANAVEDAPWKDIDCRLDSRKISKTLYVRNSITAGDIRTSDIARFIIATVGMADTAAVGKLWVSYDVSLSAPVTIPGTPHCTAITQWFNDADQVYAGAALNKGMLLHDGLNLSRYQTTTQPSQLNLPAGSYRITLQFGAKRLAAGTMTPSIFADYGAGFDEVSTTLPKFINVTTGSYTLVSMSTILMGDSCALYVKMTMDNGATVTDYSLTVEAA